MLVDSRVVTDAGMEEEEVEGEVLYRRLELWNATDPGTKKEGKRAKVVSLVLCHEYDFRPRRQGKKVSIR